MDDFTESEAQKKEWEYDSEFNQARLHGRYRKTMQD